MEKINDSLFKSTRLSEQSMRFLLGGKVEEGETGAGSKTLSDGRCFDYTSDYEREDGGMNYSGITWAP